MEENQEIQAGDVVCLKSDKSSHTHKKFTVGGIADRDGDEVYIYWVVQGEFKTSKVNKAALHKLS